MKKTIDRTKLACYITDRTKRGTEKDKEKILGSSSKVQKLPILPEGREKPLTIITQ